TLADRLDLDDLKTAFKKRSYSPAIEQMFKLHKNSYPASRIAEIYGISLRRTQSILKELGLNRSKSEALLISPNVNRCSDGDSPDLFIKRRIPLDELQLPESLEDFLNYLNVIRAKSPNTINGYRNDLILFFRFMKRYKKLCPKDMEISDIEISDMGSEFIKKINLMDLYAFLAFLENERSNSSYARARKVASLRSFFKFLHTKAKIIDFNPTAELESPKIVKRHPVYLTLDESKDLLKSVDSENKHQKRDYCIITLFLNCGLRLSELCSINISSIKGDILTIIGKGNKERTVYLNKACIKAISEYMTERNLMNILPSHRDALFISERKSRINMRTIEKIVKKYIEDAGLDKDKYSPHKLRHTAATLMYKYGNVDIRSLQMILGHENINTTQIYTHVDDEKLRNAVSSNPLSEE
ncbi:MAG: tyrosine recombinase XerC, partial [Firmicutes bacterium]|nr:tyrosine recombinase XerC [Bacillota bacterium]